MIDYERVLISLLSDVGEDLHGRYDFEGIVSKAKLDENGNIVVEHSDFRFVYDGRTYDQIEGQGLLNGSEKLE